VEENCRTKCNQQYYAHKGIRRKKRRIQAAQIVSSDEPVLVQKQTGRQHNAR